jgi:hypothetical protein
MSDDQTEQLSKEKKTEESTPQQSGSRFHVPKFSLKGAVVLTAVLLVILGLAIGAAYLFAPASVKNSKIVIGDTTITKADIDKYVKEWNIQNNNNPAALSFDDTTHLPVNERKEALNRLVTNAALKLEAQQLHVKLHNSDYTLANGDKMSQAEIDTISKGYKSRVDLENRTYETKLADALIAKKDILLARITYDTPYFNRAPADKVQGYYTDAKSRLNREILPPMKSGMSKEELAKKADVVLFDESNQNNKNWQQYFEKSVIVLDLKQNYSPQLVPGLDDVPETARGNVNVGTPVDLAKEVNKLSNIGDTSQVFVSKTGAFTIVRLENKSKGKYSSWEDLLAKYNEKYVTGKTNLARVMSSTSRNLANVLGKASIAIANKSILVIMSIGSAKASAAIPPDGCSSHNVDFIVRAYNVDTDDYLSGASMTIRRTAQHPCGNQYEGSHVITSGSNNTYHDNCFGPEPEFIGPNSSQHPAGYSSGDYLGMQWRDKDDPTWRNGSPPWNPETINQARVVYIRLLYKGGGGPPGNKWTLTPRSYIDGSDHGTNMSEWGTPGQDMNVSPGVTVYFMHTVTNNGAYQANDYNRQRINTTWDPNGNLISYTTDLASTEDLAGGSVRHISGGAFKVPSAPPGTVWCQEIQINPARADFAPDGSTIRNNTPVNSDRACVRAAYFDLQPLSFVNSEYTELGGTATFDHALQNTGNDYNLFWNSSPSTWGVVRAWPRISYNPSSPNGPPDLSASGEPSYLQGQEDCPSDILAIQGGETRYFTWQLLSGGSCVPATGHTLSVPGNGPLGRGYCQSYKVNPAFIVGSYFDPPFYQDNPRTSAPACTYVVGGKTSIALGLDAGDSAWIEPTESSTINIGTITNSFTQDPAKLWPGYTVDCNYVIKTYAPSGALQSSSAATGCSTFIGSNNPTNAATYTVNPAPGTPYGTKICVDATLTGARGPSNANNPNFLGPVATGTLCIRVVAKPYFKAYGSDVIVGQGTNGGACNVNASVIGWNKDAAGNYAGAGNQFAVFAASQIRYFATGQGLPVSGDTYGNAPSKLAFANTGLSQTVGLNGFYGGEFTGMSCSMQGYYNDSLPATTPTWTSIRQSNLDRTTNANLVYKASGQVKIAGIAEDSANTLLNGNNTKLYVDGNVLITSDIVAVKGASSIAQIPGFTVIVKGNIYISSDVSQLYGTYVAQPNGAGSGGNIYTCANEATFTQYNPIVGDASNPDYTTCSTTKLTVTGSLVAKKINFLRTRGSRYLDANGLDGQSGAGYSNAAEVFQYNPLTWLRQSTTTTNASNTTYDSITSLPPVL